MDVLQKEIDEVYATQPTAHETLDYGVVEQHQRFIRSSFEPEELRYCSSMGSFSGTYSRRGCFKRN